ncbi:MAG TPA: Tim44 domain-containing protein [Thermodesulfobacteriota bacterium]|nr:Tim44 domain-containing protein [Thermodesulfobacteriota bacterium]
MKIVGHRPGAILGLLITLFFVVWLGFDAEVFARAGGGRSSGSRGFNSGRSFQRNPSPAPPPQQREYQQPQQTPPPTGPGRSFMSGLAGGMLGGLLGGMLFRGMGFAGSEMGDGGFGFGDIFLILVVLGLIYFVVKRFRSRQNMQMGMAGAGPSSYSYGGTSLEPTFSALPPAGPAGLPVSEELRNIKALDSSFDEKSFKDLAEDIFFKIQGGWTRRDLNGVRNLFSPEMFGILKKDLDDLIARKQINRLENIAVREVEIADAGQDRGEEYITVRLYANLLDYVVDEKSGQVISGSSSDPVKFVEYWTFTRNVGDKNWVLGGITQEADR